MVRRAKPHDGAALFLLARTFSTSFTVEQSAFERAFFDLLTYPDAFLSVAEVEGKVAGYLLGFDHPTFFANGRVAWAEEIMVEEAHRRQGIARNLMAAFE